MDGNGRWASKKNLSKKLGHEAGINNCINICRNLNKINYKINELSFYVFSTENWKRKPNEIRDLFNLINQFYLKFSKVANDENLVIRHCGTKEKLSKNLIKIIEDVTYQTKNNTGTFINLMFNYGSRKEINDAVKKIFAEKTSKKDFRSYLYLPNSKDPDLIIRTGGEKRLSNFLLWQSAYAELYFTNTLWPEFKFSNLNRALDSFYKRKRNYGK